MEQPRARSLYLDVAESAASRLGKDIETAGNDSRTPDPE